jgi:Domain of unknown function (DUF4384)
VCVEGRRLPGSVAAVWPCEGENDELKGFLKGTVCGRAVVAAAVGMFVAAGVHAQEARQITVEQLPIFNLTPAASTLGVDVWTNRVDATYAVGEEMTLFVRTSHDAAVTILNVDAAGKTTRLFPNQFTPDNRLHASQVYQMPGSNASFKLRVGGPAGVNVIKVIATTVSKPIFQGHVARSSEPFETYEDSSADLARQIEVVMNQQPPGVWAMAERPIRVVTQPVAVQPPQFISVPGPRPVVVGTPAPPAQPPQPPVNVIPVVQPPFGLGSIPSAFVLDLHAMKPSYRVGEELTLSVTPERNCKLTLLSLDTQNNATVLYPNRLESEPSLRAGRTSFLPGTDGKMRFTLLGSPGVQSVVALCGEEWTLLGSLFKSSDTDRAVYPTVGSDTNIAQLITAQLQSGRKLAHATTSFVLTP